MQLGAGLCINVAPLACRAGESPDQGRGSTRLLQDEMIPTPSASSAGQGGHLGPRPGPPDWPPLTGTSRLAAAHRDLQGLPVAPAITIFWNHPSTDLGAGRAERLAQSSGPAGALEFFHQRGLGHPGLGAALGALTGLDCPSVEASRLGPAGGLTPRPSCGAAPDSGDSTPSPKPAHGMAGRPPLSSGERGTSLQPQ